MFLYFLYDLICSTYKSFLCEGDEEDSRNVDSIGHTQWADRSGGWGAVIRASKLVA